jgi:SAM-dependent methyltransferase
MRQLSECVVCGGKEFTEYAASTFVGGVSEASQHFLAHRKSVARGRIVSCRSCGFRFTNPQFDPSEYDEIYKAAPRRGPSDQPMDNADMQRFRRLARYIREDVGRGGRFLDFGCGKGGFLTAMNDPAGLGFEVGDSGTRTEGGYTIVTGKFFQLLGDEPLLDGAFDYITAFDVFEHLPDLDKYVQALRRLLAPGGRLVVTVPDLGSWMAAITGRRWSMYLLEHLWFFDKTTLASFMARAGFRETQFRKVPYDASLAHIARRFSHTYAPAVASLSRSLPEMIVPVPAGILYAVYESSSLPESTPHHEVAKQ